MAGNGWMDKGGTSADGTAIARRDPVAEVGALMKRMGGEIMAALPRTSGLTPERLARIAVTTLRTTPALAKCSVPSLLGALVQCAQLGLEPDPRLGLAYLVPYGQDAQLIVGYRGMIALARRSGEVASVEAHVVYDRDAFECSYGAAPVLTHTPCLQGDRGEPFAVYALARFKDGTLLWDVMTADEVEKVRSRSRASKGGPWVTDWAEMARKTVVRRLAKYLPLSVEWADAQESDGAVVTGLDRGRPVLADGPVIGEVADDPAASGELVDDDQVPA